MKEPVWKENLLTFLWLHVFIAYAAALALICRYWIAPLLP